jgi:hypothetical protein
VYCLYTAFTRNLWTGVAEVNRHWNRRTKVLQLINSFKAELETTFRTCTVYPLRSMWEMTVRHWCTRILYRRVAPICIWVTYLFTLIRPEHLRKFRGRFSSLIAMAILFHVQSVEWRRIIRSACLSWCVTQPVLSRVVMCWWRGSMFGLVSSCLDVQSYWNAKSWAAPSVFDFSPRSKGLKRGHSRLFD